MITIDSEQCVGCGACVDACPTGAIQLVDGVARVDQAKCRQCEACVAVCPRHAISVVAEQEPATQPVDIVPVPPPSIFVHPPVRTPVRTASRVLPWVGAALAFVGREVVPRVAVSLLDAWDRRSQTSVPTVEKPSSTNLIHRSVFDASGRGRHRRQRRRGQW